MGCTFLAMPSWFIAMPRTPVVPTSTYWQRTAHMLVVTALAWSAPLSAAPSGLPGAVATPELLCAAAQAPAALPALSNAACTQALQGNNATVLAPAQQLLLWSMDGGSHAYTVQVWGPDGKLLRQWPALHNGVQDIGWVAPQTGHYRLQAIPAHTSTPAQALPPVQWKLRASAPAQPENSELPTPTQAPAAALLRQIQAQLQHTPVSQHEALLAQFWQQVQTQGSPWLEALPQNPHEVLTTFLWRAPAGMPNPAHNVRLEWAVRSATPLTFEPLAGTDIWFVSLPLPRSFHASYQIVSDPARYPAATGANVGRVQRVRTQQLFAQRDALNPHIWHTPTARQTQGTPAAPFAQRSVLHISSEGVLRNLGSSADVPAPKQLQGQLQHLRFHSTQLGNARNISLYTPAGTPPSSSWPLLVLFDREAYLEHVQVLHQLEHAVQQGQLPPMAVLLVSNPTRDDRGQELPPHTPAFGHMLASELLPWIRAQAPTLSTEAAHTVIAGSSFGGLAAGAIAWAHPQTFGHVLSLSGSYWWAPTPTPTPAAAAHRWSEGDWLIQQIAQAPLQPIRWHLAYGLLERSVNGAPGIVDNNRHLRNVLHAKGYSVSTQEIAAGHDYYAWGPALVHGLQHLLPPQQATVSLPTAAQNAHKKPVSAP